MTGSHSTKHKSCDDTLSVAVENTGRLGRHLGLGFSYLGKSACAEHWSGTVQRGSVCSHSTDVRQGCGITAASKAQMQAEWTVNSRFQNRPHDDCFIHESGEPKGRLRVCTYPWYEACMYACLLYMHSPYGVYIRYT